MMSGAVLAYLVLVPTIYFFGDSLDEPVLPRHVADPRHERRAIRADYVRYIGAGAVAAGGIISLLRALPLIVGSLWPAFAICAPPGTEAAVRRTDRDLPQTVVWVGMPVAGAAIWLSLPLGSVFNVRALVAAPADRALRLPVRHRLLAADRRDRLLVESHFRHDRGHAALDLPDLPGLAAGRTGAYRLIGPDRGGRGLRRRRPTAARPRRT